MGSSSPPQTKAQTVFFAESGVEYRLQNTANPFEAWMNLMEAVEALCPVWPERSVITVGEFKL
jgi:hypothetical protein